MMTVTRMTASEIEEALKTLPAWTIQDGKLFREYRFSDFVTAFGFMTEVALVAERQGHHPEWFNVWNLVRVELTTHDAQGISARDFLLAAELERLAGLRSAT